MRELINLSVTDISAAVVSRQASPTELTEAYLARIEALNPELTAYVEVTADRARADAARLIEEAVRREFRGPLHGVPIGLKDLIDTAGIPTAAGSAAYARVWCEAGLTAPAVPLVLFACSRKGPEGRIPSDDD